MGVAPVPEADSQGVFGYVKSFLFRKRKRQIDSPDDDEVDKVAPRHKLPRVNPDHFLARVDRVAEAEATKRAYEDATRPVAVPLSQVSSGAEDVNHTDRKAPNPQEALMIEQNMPLG